MRAPLSVFRNSTRYRTMILAASTLLENLTDDVNCLALWDEIFDHFPLFDDTLRHIELCNSVISQIQENTPKLCLQCRITAKGSGSGSSDVELCEEAYFEPISLTKSLNFSLLLQSDCLYISIYIYILYFSSASALKFRI